MVSIVICGYIQEKLDRISRMYARLLAGRELEVVEIRDAKSAAEGNNRGLALSQGELVIFSHDDVEFLAADFGDRLLNHMKYCDVLGVAGTRVLTGPGWRTAGPPYLYGQIATPSDDKPGKFNVTLWSAPARRVDKMQALDGVFLCVRRSVAEAVSFDHQTFTDTHLYDVDFTYRAFKAGFNLSVALDLCPIHENPDSYGREWIPHAQAFLKKMGNQLVIQPAASFQTATAVAINKQDIVPFMSPSHWND